MKKLSLSLSLSFGLLFTLCAQSFTFSDTYPVNNPDSLEAWLAANPTPSVERLKNLIKLERTYFNSYGERSEMEMSEINQLANTFKNPIGQASYYWLITKRKTSQWTLSDFNHAIQAHDIFKTSKDTSGLITVLGLLAFINNESLADNFDNNNAAKDYLYQAESLLSARFNHYDNIELFLSKPFQRIRALKSDSMIVNRVEEFISFYERQPIYAYAIPRLRIQQAHLWHYKWDYKQSYLTLKKALSILRPRQERALFIILGSLTNDCLKLNLHAERLKYAETGLNLLKKSSNRNIVAKSLIFGSLKEELFRLGRYKEAAIYGDSTWSIDHQMYENQRYVQVLNIQERYQDADKRKQIAELTLKQKENESRNRFILTVSFAALLVSVVFGVLWTQLRQKNKLLFEANEQLQAHTRTREQFFAIIAHDLRRPFLAFQGMSELVSFYLKKGDYTAIQKISQSIDESGLRIRQLLDNLLKWALSQKEEVPYAPKKTNLLSEIQSVVKIYESAYAYQAIKFDVDCAENIIVFVDRNALELILRNLISNALSGILNDNGLISISARTNADKVMLSVMDNGKGLDDVKIATIRQVLANPNMGEAGQNGLGFGLILISKFTKRNNIDVNVKSKLGEGTCFELLLPTI